MIWREALCDGPVKGSIQDDLFWKRRASYIQDALGGENYELKMITELDKIRDLSSYEEVVLWFEYDLFCQVNLLACLSFIDHERISLVCLGDELDGQLRGLGAISARHFVTLFKNRAHLTVADISYAKTAWEAYAHPDPENLQKLAPSSAYKHLEPALAAHFTRLPERNGLNEIEEKMLRLIKEGINEERKLIGTMLSNQGYFGLGDLQYLHYLDQLSPLLEENTLEINELGNMVLQGVTVFPQPHQYIGGVFRPDYYQNQWGRTSN